MPTKATLKTLPAHLAARVVTVPARSARQAGAVSNDRGAAGVTIPEPGRSSLCEQLSQSVTFAGRVPGNNGADGLLRLHWSKRQKLLGQYEWVVAAARLAPMCGPVRLELVRYSTGSPMDYDNLVSTGKLLVDALVRCGVLPDDTPAVLAERVYRQERAEGKGYQRTEITLTTITEYLK